MKKYFAAIMVSIFLIILLVSGCTPGTSGKPAPTTVPETSPVPTEAPEASPAPIEPTEPAIKSEFSIITDAGSISLEDWDNKVGLNSILGKAASEETRVLDQTADTFAGSYIKKLEYDGLELELFSPKDNGKTFWIKEIIVTGSSYKTPRGVSIGSSLEELTEKYAEIQQLPDGRKGPNNCAYIYKDDTGFSNMVFEVKDGKIANIKIYKEMP